MSLKFVFICLFLGQSIKPADFNHEPKCSSAFDLVYQSSDGGLTWQDVSSGLPAKLMVTNILEDGQEIILSSDNGIYRSQTGLNRPLWKKDAFMNDKISAVFKGRSSSYARNFDNDFYKQVANTGTWLPVFKNLNGVWKWSFQETTNGSILIGTDRGIFKSKDSGLSWNKVFPDEKVWKMVQQGEVLLASCFDGILRSKDGGESWQRVLKESRMIRKLGFIGEQVFVILSGDDGKQQKNEPGLKEMTDKILISSDKGTTWRQMDERWMEGRFVYSSQSLSNPEWFINDLTQIGKYLLCSIDAGIFRSADQGKSWTRVFTPKDNQIFNFTSTGKVIYAVKANKGC